MKIVEEIDLQEIADALSGLAFKRFSYKLTEGTKLTSRVKLNLSHGQVESATVTFYSEEKEKNNYPVPKFKDINPIDSDFSAEDFYKK